MVSEKIRKLREGVQERKQQAAERRERARFRKELTKSKIRESGPVQEAKATKRELKQLGQEVGEPVAGIARKAAGGAERVRKAAGQFEGSLDGVQQIESDVLGEMGGGRRSSSQTVRELKQSGAQKGSKAAETAFENKVKRRVKRERLEQLEQAAPDQFGQAGNEFGVDLEVVDDLERGERGAMGDLGFDTVFDAPAGDGLLGEGRRDDLEVVGEDTFEEGL